MGYMLGNRNVAIGVKDAGTLKEAIADAKAVRDIAVENARIALQEAFSPKIKI